MGIGWTEVLLVVAVLVLFFGASKIPELARGVGEGLNEFKNATSKELDNDKNEAETTSNSKEEKVKSS